MAKITIELDDELIARLIAGAPELLEAAIRNAEYRAARDSEFGRGYNAAKNGQRRDVQKESADWYAGYDARAAIGIDDGRDSAGAQVLHAAVVPAQAEPETAGEADEALPDRDSAGVPWDARIHSDSRARNSDGTWRKRRGVDSALVEAVTKELAAGCGATEQNDVPAVPPPPPWVEALAEAAPLLVERIEAANAEIPPPPVAVAPVRTVSDITLAVATGRVLLADLVALCAEAGVSGVHELASNPEALSLVVSALEARGVWSE